MLAGVIVKLIVIRDDAMQEGGKRPPMIRVSGEAERHDHAVRIEIIDNGPHIPKELKELMFSPYFFPESDNHLVIVRDVIELHSGHIEERGTVDSGAHFVIHIPQLAIES
jgi:signal transduction histidine kinase